MTTTVDSIIGTALAGFQTQLYAVAGVALPIAASVLALTVGWRFAKRFVKSA